jgi:hypothetical protein
MGQIGFRKNDLSKLGKCFAYVLNGPVGIIEIK